jgi:superfamily I DNA and RNA helicase
MTSRVSGGLATWVARLALNPHRLLVRGTAGSGKTQLAMQELRQAARLGQQALYICYNRPLADAVKAVAPNTVNVMTIHEFARELGEQAGETFDFSVAGVYDRMIDALLAYAPQITEALDVLVVDEAQDMDASWINALVSMVKTEGRITVLEDPAQRLYDRPAFNPGWSTIQSPINYRSPRLLVDFMNHFELCDSPIEAGSTVTGFNPAWHWYVDPATLIDETEHALKALMDQGYAPENIVILTYQGLANSKLFSGDAPRGLNQIALKRQDGYDQSGHVKYTDGRVLVETLYRFKGQAADAVILTEVDFEELDSKNRRKLFVAFSRARLHVTFITSERARDVLLEKSG